MSIVSTSKEFIVARAEIRANELGKEKERDEDGEYDEGRGKKREEEGRKDRRERKTMKESEKNEKDTQRMMKDDRNRTEQRRWKKRKHDQLADYSRTNHEPLT
jgi:hypothetical protein